MGPGRARAGVFLFVGLALASLSLVPEGAVAGAYHRLGGQPDTASPLEQVTDTNQRLAQSFEPTANFTLTRISAYVLDRGTSNPLSLRVVADAAGMPDDATVLVSGANDTAAAYEWGDFDLSPWIDVALGTRYWIVLDSPGGNGNGYAWRYTAADAYASGSASLTVANTWTPLAGDFAFLLYGWSPPSLTVSVAADRPEVASGESLRYAITLNNTGTENATDVWVNATVDARLQITNASGPGTASVAGSVVTFHAPSVSAGDTAFAVEARAGVLLDDGDVLALPVTATYVVNGTGITAVGNAVAAVRAPRIVAQIGFAGTAASPGDVVTFRVTLANEGHDAARDVWLNETLHPALTYLNDTSPVPPLQDGAQQSWHFIDVPPGSAQFDVIAQIRPDVAEETVVTNFLSVTYTDRLGAGLVRGKSNTVWFDVVAAPGPSPWLWGSFAISATVVGGSYVLYARRRLRTEEIFLIHHSGVLLVHMSKTMRSDLDSDILSGMFTAILNFVRDAFHHERHEELQGLDLGDFRVHIRKGGITYLALVHSGKTTRWLARTAAVAVQEIESEYGDMLRSWDGDLRTLAGVREILRGHFLSPTGPSRSHGWMRGAVARLDQSFKRMRPL